ncbi:MAG: hypothetical protein GY931_19685 [Maribacter sp.]|nr:hypothetical protein [Maribacter sp.]
MNYYIVVEGKRTEKIVFSEWIPQLNRSLNQVSLPGELVRNNFMIMTGKGYPNILKIVRNAAQDISAFPHYGQLIVSLDAEDEDPQVVRNIVLTTVHNVNRQLNPEIIVQNSCIESWFLGNQRAFRRFPQSLEAQAWKRFYDVQNHCPEQLPANTEKELNRAQTAFAYLVCGLNDRSAHQRYSKSRPYLVCEPIYLNRLQERADTTGHLPSFQQFVNLF